MFGNSTAEVGNKSLVPWQHLVSILIPNHIYLGAGKIQQQV